MQGLPPYRHCHHRGDLRRGVILTPIQYPLALPLSPNRERGFSVLSDFILFFNYIIPYILEKIKFSRKPQCSQNFILKFCSWYKGKFDTACQNFPAVVAVIRVKFCGRPVLISQLVFVCRRGTYTAAAHLRFGIH